MLISTKHLTLGVWAVAGLIILLGFMANALDLRINLTPSMPMGLYQAQARLSGQPLQRGALVLVCPPDTPALQLAINRHYIGAGSCPNHSQPLLKPVAAVAGDTVTLASKGIRINQTWLPNSSIQKTDSAGRPLPHWPYGRYSVPPGEFWLLSTHSPNSFDSRYFGPIRQTGITATVTPIWTGDKQP